jgi:YidC/Oxa1 family membrane protein insertase
MTPATRRLLIILATASAAALVFILVVTGGGSRQPTRDADPAPATLPREDASAAAAPPAAPSTVETPGAGAPAPAPAAARPLADGDLVAEPAEGLPGALPPLSAERPPTPLGSLDPEVAPYRIEFAPTGAGIDRVVFSRYWNTATQRRAFEAHERAVARGAAPPPLPPDSDRYQFRTLGSLGGFDVPLLSMRLLFVEDRPVNLFGAVWSEVSPGRFRSRVRDAAGTPLLEVERAFVVGEGPVEGYRIRLEQRVRNLVDRPLRVRWEQYGPGDLERDQDSYIETRRLHFGYLLPPDRDPAQATVITGGQMLERKTVLDQTRAGDTSLWPNRDSEKGRYSAAWFGSTNRYFSLAVYAPFAPPQDPSRAMTASVSEVRSQIGGLPGAEVLFTVLYGPEKVVPAGGTASWDLGVFAGPLERNLLFRAEPFDALYLGGLITYVMSTCCTICTFAWLANLLIVLLTFLQEWVVFDWGFAIIALVLFVRLLLHPLTRRAQIQMTRFGKAMGALKPELDALQKKYRDDPKKLQQEQMRLYREKRINPAGCLGGMLPTFLQMPIWIALYAMLFFAFELRQTPAFFGVFQQMGGWTFLGDLSAQDRFIPLSRPVDLWLFTLTGFNLLPLLMGFVFWFQQKYLSPPTSAAMSEEQKQQQKIMKIMMVVMFPVMLYAAPSGLTLYILTSSCIGIVEGRIVRRKIEEMDAAREAEEAAGGGPSRPAAKEAGKPKDRLGRLYAEAMERARQRQEEKKRKTKRFKDRN